MHCTGESASSVEPPGLGAVKKVKGDIALPGNPISELWDVTCYVGSYSVTFHPTQVNAPRQTPAGGMEG